MGTQPEEIEHALRGRRTLPQPGEPEQLGAEAERKARTSPEAQPAEASAELARRERRGPAGRMLTEDEEKRSGLRGGRWNAASDRDRV